LKLPLPDVEKGGRLGDGKDPKKGLFEEGKRTSGKEVMLGLPVLPIPSHLLRKELHKWEFIEEKTKAGGLMAPGLSSTLMPWTPSPAR